MDFVMKNMDYLLQIAPELPIEHPPVLHWFAQGKAFKSIRNSGNQEKDRRNLFRAPILAGMGYIFPKWVICFPLFFS